MYAIRTPKGLSTDVFVMLPPTLRMQNNNPMVQWLREHSVEDGWRDGQIVGVYLGDIDAVAFKLKFGL